MASTEINIMDEEPSVLVFSGVGTFELVLGSVSVTMTADQFDKLIGQMTPWIVEDETQPEQASEARVKPSASIASFPVDVLGAPMREYAPGKWESATWPSDALAATHPAQASEKDND